MNRISLKTGSARYSSRILLGGVLVFSLFSLKAQQDTMKMTGVYFMRGVMETASVIELKPDSSFEFFFSQGALDRYGKGAWHAEGNTVIFNSRPRPSRDFALVSSKAGSDNFLTIKLVEKNTMILPYTMVSLKAGDKILQKTTDSHGEVHFPKQSFGSISLLFTLCPDRESIFPIENKTHNYFEFRLEPWIAEVFFSNFSLRLAGKELRGRHPLLQGDSFSYEKE